MAKVDSRERLANWVHELWRGWMKFLLAQCDHNPDGTVTIPAEYVKKWKRQMRTSLKNLPAAEQKSDYEISDRLIKLIKSLKPKAKRKADPRVNEVKATFINYCENIQNFTPVINHVIEGAIIKKKLQQFSVEELTDCFDWFLNNEDYAKFSPTIKTVLSNGVFNKWLRER